MPIRFSDLDQFTQDIERIGSDGPDSFLIELLDRSMIIVEKQESKLVKKGLRNGVFICDGGFVGYGAY